MQSLDPPASLIVAAARGDVKHIALLLENGANVNEETEDGSTPLTEAAIFGHTAAAELLISRKANVNHAKPPGYSALFRAASLGHKQAVQVLLAAGADKHLRYQGVTPAERALAHGQHDIAALLDRWGEVSLLLVSASTFFLRYRHLSHSHRPSAALLKRNRMPALMSAVRANQICPATRQPLLLNAKLAKCSIWSVSTYLFGSVSFLHTVGGMSRLEQLFTPAIPLELDERQALSLFEVELPKTIPVCYRICMRLTCLTHTGCQSKALGFCSVCSFCLCTARR